jgi:hypothetical protein
MDGSGRIGGGPQNNAREFREVFVRAPASFTKLASLCFNIPNDFRFLNE